MASYDLLVIGAGPGGYVAAIRASQLGMRVACVDERETLGGTCLNIGCIPSKALLHASELYATAAHQFSTLGIEVEGLRLNLARMQATKQDIVEKLTRGIEGLFAKNKIEHLRGTATLTGPQTVAVSYKGQTTSYEARAILVASGSVSASLPGLDIDEDQVVSSTGALAFQEVPPSLIVVGGGVIGLELGSVWQRLGAHVTVVEFADSILPGQDPAICKNFLRILKKQKWQVHLGTRVTGLQRKDNMCELTLEGGTTQTLQGHKVLVAVGRRPKTEGLGLEQLGIELDAKGALKVNEAFQTSVPTVYAIGDCIPGPMLAHKAEEEGVACVEKMAGKKTHLNYDAIPAVVYTAPEVASVGKTEPELQAAGVPVRTGSFSMMANSRARANSQTDGLVKLVVHAETDRLLGAHIIGTSAGDIIHELAAVLEYGGSGADIACLCHAHPTFSEAVKEAALALEGRAIHA